MLILYGQASLSPFRRDLLLKRLQKVTPAIGTLQSNTVYFIEVKADFSKQQHLLLEHLLQAQSEPKYILSQTTLIVIPRFGTISPWSSKTTELLHHCGLEQLQQIEHGVIYSFDLKNEAKLTEDESRQIKVLLADRMTETVIDNLAVAAKLFVQDLPGRFTQIDVLTQGKKILQHYNQTAGLALTDDEINYLSNAFTNLKRNPTDVELMMFAQANSEHCRHKTFNATWSIDGQPKDKTLFEMIRYTYQQSPEGILSAYHDNAAVIQGASTANFRANPISRQYEYQEEPIHLVFKVETHNHPSAIAPFAGCATGAGGEIRDEGATGRGAKPKAGLTGFTTSHLRIPGLSQPWEQANPGKPANIASPLDIMLAGPIGAASFNNEFGRPNLCGYFRTFEYYDVCQQQWLGYHKPIMIAGGIGNIGRQHVNKKTLPNHASIGVLGGPAMHIGLGGGAASSLAFGQSDSALDFASVQRSNPEMQRRAQEVINQCWALGEHNPILSIHDVGAGGLSNAIPEIVNDSAKGATINLRAIPNAEMAMSPLEIWCNEAQERYILVIHPENVSQLVQIAKRERCPFTVVGEVTEVRQLLVKDDYFANYPIDVGFELLFGKPPSMKRVVKRALRLGTELNLAGIQFSEAIKRTLMFPAVASKSFLITIGDRQVGGLSARDQLVGPWQVPVADAAVTALGFKTDEGEALAMGERSPIAVLNAAAAARLAVAEAITNIASTDIEKLSDIVLSANWMAASNQPGEAANLYDAVQAVAMALCPALKIAIPVGKDSLSMRTQWREANQEKSLVSPVSLVITAVAPVKDIRRTLTPELRTDCGETLLILLDISGGKQRLAGSVFAQVYNQLGTLPPDLDDPQKLISFFNAIKRLHGAGLLLAYHDRCDGGLVACICEMAFAGHTGVDIELEPLGKATFASSFNEELGAVIQIRKADLTRVIKLLGDLGMAEQAHIIGRPNDSDRIVFSYQRSPLSSEKRSTWHRIWSKTSYHMQLIRDNPECAQQAYDALLDSNDPGLNVALTTPLCQSIPLFNLNPKPRVAILREQGINGHLEMAAAFECAGFTAVDVHMSDILSGEISLEAFVGLVACGGFSYGDVLGAGRGWAHTILHHPRAKEVFSNFFHRPDSFALGICNGCQMFSYLTDLIPGSTHWPRFVANQSEQFESRWVLTEILPTPAIFFKNMSHARLLVPVAHGEGQVVFPDQAKMKLASQANLVVLRYVDNYGKATETYPANPNGSSAGMTGFTNLDGRVTILMPHPERAFRTTQHAWHPGDWGEYGPWMQMFINCRAWVN